MSARRIVDAALAFEAEGMDPEAALAAACERVRGVSPAAVQRAQMTLEKLDRRAGRVEVVLPDRRPDGRFTRGEAR